MRVNHTRLTLAILVLFSATTASAQKGADKPDLGNLLPPGMTVWITDDSGQEQQARIVGVSGEAVTTSAAGVSRRLTTNDIRRVEVRRSDSLLNGALIGAGAAIASGASRRKTWRPTTGGLKSATKGTHSSHLALRAIRVSPIDRTPIVVCSINSRSAPPGAPKCAEVWPRPPAYLAVRA